MNSKTNAVMVTAITMLLIMGSSIVPMQSHASGENKKTGDFKSSIKASAELDKKSLSQHSGQDNFGYRSDDPSQANQGQPIIGKDNEASGFNDQIKNLQSTPATTGTASGTGNNGNGTTPTPPPPTTGTLNVCKEVINNAPSGSVKPSDFTFTFTSEGANPAEFAGSVDCTKVTVPEGPYSFIESGPPIPIFPSLSGDCSQDSIRGDTFIGSIKAGETQTCTVTNTLGEDE